VVIDWTGADRFALQQQTGPLKFWRASTYHATNEVCNNHLKQIRFARLLYGYENHLLLQDSVFFSNIVPYFKGGNIPACPASGVYSLFGGFTSLPTCNLINHVLEEPEPSMTPN
jgi:hypothetical protein